MAVIHPKKVRSEINAHKNVIVAHAESSTGRRKRKIAKHTKKVIRKVPGAATITGATRKARRLPEMIRQHAARLDYLERRVKELESIVKSADKLP